MPDNMPTKTQQETAWRHAKRRRGPIIPSAELERVRLAHEKRLRRGRAAD